MLSVPVKSGGRRGGKPAARCEGAGDRRLRACGRPDSPALRGDEPAADPAPLPRVSPSAAVAGWRRSPPPRPRRPGGPARGGAARGRPGATVGGGGAGPAAPAGVNGVRQPPRSHSLAGAQSSGRLRGDGGASLSPSLVPRAGNVRLGGGSEETIKLSDLVRLFFFFLFFFLLASVVPFHVKFNVFRVSLGCVMCRAISGGSREWQPAAGAEAASRVSETPEPDTSPTHPTYSPTRPALPSARNLRVPSFHLPRKLPVLAGGMQGRGSALGNCKRQFHRADYLYSLPMFMSCSVRQCTRSCCVGAIQDYLLGHVCRAAPGG